jgi:hypothetical protein
VLIAASGREDEGEVYRYRYGRSAVAEVRFESERFTITMNEVVITTSGLLFDTRAPMQVAHSDSLQLRAIGSGSVETLNEHADDGKEYLPNSMSSLRAFQ